LAFLILNINSADISRGGRGLLAPGAHFATTFIGSLG